MAGTERLFLEDPYLESCDATVTSRHEGCVELDRTVFYGHSHEYLHPQATDQGLLRSRGGSLRVKRVDGSAGRILHYVEGRPLPTRGTRVVAALDVPRRRAAMRLHTAVHGLLAVAERLRLRTRLIASRSPEVEALTAQMYFEPGSLPEASARGAIDGVREAFRPARRVTVRWVPRKEALARPDAARLRISRIPAVHDPLRFVSIDGLCEHPCDGTLVRSTGEVGSVVLRDLVRMRSGDKLVLGLADLSVPEALSPPP